MSTWQSPRTLSDFESLDRLVWPTADHRNICIFFWTLEDSLFEAIQSHVLRRFQTQEYRMHPLLGSSKRVNSRGSFPAASDSRTWTPNITLQRGINIAQIHPRCYLLFERHLTTGDLASLQLVHSCPSSLLLRLIPIVVLRLLHPRDSFLSEVTLVTKTPPFGTGTRTTNRWRATACIDER